MDYMQIINKYPESCQWKVLLRNNRLIDYIKELRKAENLLLKEAKDVVEFYRDTLRAKAAAVPSCLTLELPAGVNLIVRTNRDGTFSVEQTEIVARSLTHAELLRCIAEQSMRVAVNSR